MPKPKNAANISRTNTVATSIFNAELLPVATVVLEVDLDVGVTASLI
jgi:hypothetical protein